MDVKKQHFVLVHGACHGAWCWYKLETLLSAAGHQVTSLDMAASGTDPRQIDDLTSVSDYFEPLMTFMESVSVDERVILVGHSFNGFAISLAMEKFPEKVSVAVFATAVMLPPSASFPQLLRKTIAEYSNVSGGGVSNLDGDSENDKACDQKNDELTSVYYDREFMETTMYQCSPPEAVTLAVKSVRPFLMFSIENMLEVIQLSKERYGSVRRAYVMAGEDKMNTLDQQEMMIFMFPPDLVKSIDGADHMVMVSEPQELCEALIGIAQTTA